MNRELKFRAFYQKKLYMQEYCGGFSYFIHNDSDALTLEDIFVAAERQKCIIQQYTGLKDKNGIPIFEGDLVRYSTAEYSTTAPVIFSPFGYGFVLDSSGRHAIGDSKYGDYLPLLSSIVQDERISYEVIGNIFETNNNE
jgi:uncharacterized phage protein (TIGR01671 family)